MRRDVQYLARALSSAGGIVRGTVPSRRGQILRSAHPSRDGSSRASLNPSGRRALRIHQGL
jgi:hypothetical protein